MATIMLLSSAITKTILNTERFAKDKWKQTFKRNIQQRRKSTRTYKNCYGRGSRACHRVTVAHNCYKGILVGEHQGENLAISVCQRVPNGVHDLFKYNNCSNSRLENRKCHCTGRCTNILTTVEPLSALRSYVNLVVQSRNFLTSSKCCESEKTVGPWAAVKEKKEKIREAGQELIEDIKETKAKVREQMDAIVERENIWTIPNLLCISRIAFSPLLGYLVISGDYEWAMGLFMFAGFTDLLDGWIARAFPSQASRLGSFLDPLADKVLVALLFLSLTYVGLIPLPLTGIIIYRDVLIILGASYVRYKSLPPPKTIVRYFDATHATAQLAPTMLSKINTAIQLGLITASLAAPVFSFTDHYLLKGLCWVTAATTISSGISYIFSRDTYKILSQMKKSS